MGAGPASDIRNTYRRGRVKSGHRTGESTSMYVVYERGTGWDRSNWLNETVRKSVWRQKDLGNTGLSGQEEGRRRERREEGKGQV